MGKKGKFTPLKNYSSEMTGHYSDTGLAFTVTMTKTAGDTCRISINGTNAVAGVSELDGNKIRPSKPQCRDMANTAHDLAQDHVDAGNGSMPKKKLSQSDVYGA